MNYGVSNDGRNKTPHHFYFHLLCNRYTPTPCIAIYHVSPISLSYEESAEMTFLPTYSVHIFEPYTLLTVVILACTFLCLLLRM